MNRVKDERKAERYRIRKHFERYFRNEEKADFAYWVQKPMYNTQV